ncbi:MAG: UDP-N-acetylglucosamine 2-epimerase (non-hydrolyzing) [Patescibacteria group bacterium]|nr:UDP-N-acetylglucosamine 2-epimerase (non-hydrolyzing) [Patescibacteria group bacterium]MDD5121288.1 UDP-N-acetylglucosamine 2-epimerase (non-hydrolyzing) [Patescibacteria group bacterium]MDD5221718.1 UDP-N-acetylglucosamine 2-epimerase (non-hydrolyzing) [Patescibacteria group bacterium]MDD5395793.1 UDP-N-acetylglucosamine 2-epimerase (non-hydrolyzing) [Patescibacteria group bacterium]
MKKIYKKLKIFCIVGARPNFVKMAPLIKEMKKYPQFIQPILVHTGQHYDQAMSKEFFKVLGLPRPDVYLYVGSGPHAKQTAEIMNRIDDVMLREKPDLVLVLGDVNSTLACALVAAKIRIPIAHVEAGLRSDNWNMPEEINRVLTDRLADFLFTTELSAKKNLLKEGIAKEKIFFVGNVMIDTLKNNLSKIRQSKILKRLGLKSKSYAVLTLHRPEVVDKKEKLLEIIDVLKLVGQKLPIIFSVHPRTQKNIKDFGLEDEFKMPSLTIVSALGYLDFLRLISRAKVVLTDSGGIQEETTVFNVPCLTLRHETERPITVTMGTNIITDLDKNKIFKQLKLILENRFKTGRTPPLWDGKAATRIVKVILKKYIRFFELSNLFLKDHNI